MNNRTIVVITDLARDYWKTFLSSISEKKVRHDGIVHKSEGRPLTVNADAIMFKWDCNDIVCLMQQQGDVSENGKKLARLLKLWRINAEEIGVAAHINGGSIDVTKMIGAKFHRPRKFHNNWTNDDRVWTVTKQLFDSLLLSQRDANFFDDLWNLLLETIPELRERVLSPLVALDLLQQAKITDVSLKRQIKAVLCLKDDVGRFSYDYDWQSLSMRVFGQNDFTVSNNGAIESFSRFVDVVRNGEDLAVDHVLLRLFAERLENKIGL